jgi:seryl-tRNA synthetase
MSCKREWKQIGSLASKMDANQAGMKAMQQKMDVNQKEIKDGTKANQAKADASQKEIRASQEHLKDLLTKMDSQIEKMEADLGEMKSVAVHEEVPEEEATMETFGALKKWHEDRCLALGRCQKLKKGTQDSGGSWKKLAAACRRMTCHAIPAWCKGQDKDKAVPRTQKGRTFGKRCWLKLEGITGIRLHSLKK